LTAGALLRLEALGLQPDVVASWKTVDNVWVRSPSGRVAVFPLPRQQGTFAAIARRADLDAALLDVARAAGVKVYDGHGVTGVRATDHVALEVEGVGSIAAHYAIAADGMWSSIRKTLSGDPSPAESTYLGEWHA